MPETFNTISFYYKITFVVSKTQTHKLKGLFGTKKLV